MKEREGGRDGGKQRKVLEGALHAGAAGGFYSDFAAAFNESNNLLIALAGRTLRSAAHSAVCVFSGSGPHYTFGFPWRLCSSQKQQWPNRFC